jgi:thiol-disulfide isomerase/thioredoxin
MNRFVFAILLLCALVGCKRETPHPQEEKTVPAGQLGSILPSFVAKDLRGHTIDSSELMNRVALIDFWATWCAPCRKEMPGYQKLLDQYGARGFVVIGFKVDMMSDTEDPTTFAQELGIHYPLLIGSEPIRNQFGGIQGLPTTFIYDHHGILRTKIIGFEYTANIEKMIKTLL